MFDRVFSLLEENKGKKIRIGASPTEQIPGTVEGEIWKKPYPINYKMPYKASSHVCDFLVLANLAEYDTVRNPYTQRFVQAIKTL